MDRIRRNIYTLVQPVLAPRNGRNLPSLVRRHRTQGTVHQQHLVELQIALGHTHGNQAEKEQCYQTLFHFLKISLCSKLEV